MKRILPLFALAAALSPAVAMAQVVIRVAPPAVVVERPVPSPGPRYVWVGGYHRWTGVRYVWVPGHYVIPPRPGVVWVAPRWVARGGGWVFVAGYWR
jgi:hypothetical protein